MRLGGNFALRTSGNINANIHLGQASFLLVQAFVVGTTFVGCISLGIFAPAFAYRIVSIDIEAIQNKKTGAAKALMKRSVVAQIFMLSAVSAIFFYPKENSLIGGLIWVASIDICVLSAFAQLFQKRLDQFGFKETERDYWLSIGVSGVLGSLSFFFLWLLHSSASPEKRGDDWVLFVVWFMIVLYSAIFSVQQKSNHGPMAVVIVGLLSIVLNFFNVLSWPFNNTAYKIGIAEPRPVTLVLPKETCFLLKGALPKSSTKLTCEGEDAGVLSNVNLLNSLGNRWVISTSKNSGNIVFDGKGVVVRKNPGTTKGGAD